MNQHKRITIIQASSRSDGDARVISSYLEKEYNVQFIDLKQKHIGQYDYKNANDNDDFLPTIKEIIAKSDKIIFLSPVYWYTMSGILKTFLDRITELLKAEKEVGRKLRGKCLGYITNSNESQLDYDIELPIKFSADYLGMHYVGHIHCGIENGAFLNNAQQDLDRYVEKL